MVSALARLTCLVRRSTAGQASGLLTVREIFVSLAGLGQDGAGLAAIVSPFGRAAAGVGGRGVATDRRRGCPSGIGPSTMYHACKERGLTAWALARRAGLSPTLVIGISLFPMHAALLGPDGRNLSGRFSGTLSPVSAGANLR